LVLFSTLVFNLSVSPVITLQKTHSSSLLWPSTPSSWSVDSRLIERQLKRRQRVADVCVARLFEDSSDNRIEPRHQLTEGGLPVPAEFYSFHVDDKHRIVYCVVPKVVCTSWKKTLIFLSGQSNASSPDELTATDVHDTPLSKQAIPRLSS